MARSSEVSSAGYWSRVASRSHRWAGVEYAASSRISSNFRLRSALGTAGTSGAEKISRSPGRRTTPAGWLRSTMPAAVSNPPASTSRPRGHAPPANRIKPRTANSALVRTNLRTRLFREGRVSQEPPALSAGLAKELHTTRFRRCTRCLIAISCTRLDAACHQQYACRSGEARFGTGESRARSTPSVPACRRRRGPRCRSFRPVVAGTRRGRVRAHGETLQIPPVGWNRYPLRCHQEGIPATKQRRSIGRYLGNRSRRGQNGRMLVPRVVRRVPEAFQAKDARPSSCRTHLPALLVVSFQVQIPDSAG